MEMRIITIESGVDMVNGMGDGRSVLKGSDLKRECMKSTCMGLEGVGEGLKISHVGQVGSRRKSSSGNRARIRVGEEVKVARRFHGNGRMGRSNGAIGLECAVHATVIGFKVDVINGERSRNRASARRCHGR